MSEAITPADDQAPEGMKVLGGEVSTQFTFGRPEDFNESIEQARVEQEQICGYALALVGTRQTHMVDDKGRDVYEVFATFAPA